MFNWLLQHILQIWGFFIFKKRVHIYGLFSVANRHNVTIGKNCAINHGVFLLGRCQIQIGNNVTLSARCMLLDATLDIDQSENIELFGYNHLSAPIILDDNVWIGAGSIILPNVRIGKNSVVGAGSVVTKDVAAYSVVAGNPAKLIRMLK